MIRTFMVDDHPLIVDALRAALDEDPEIEVGAVASTIAGARQVIASPDRFDVAVVDIRLPDGSGFDLLGDLRAAGTSIIILSSEGSPAFVDAAKQMGVQGFFLKTSPAAALVQAVKRVAAGSADWDPEAMRRTTGARWRPLTERELDVTRLVVEGLSNDEIAHRLGIATKTVEAYLSRLYERFELVSRTDLAMRAEREGWLHLPPR